MRRLKKLIKRGMRSVGFDIHRHASMANPYYQLLRALEAFDIDLVFDVGANTGGFASELRSAGYKGELVSFEPLSSAHPALQAAAIRDAKWHVYRQGAIGDFDGEVELNIAGNSVSSSVLPMMESHSSAARNSAYVASEKVPIFRLDSIAFEYLTRTRHSFLKLDTQGFEWQVLDGAQETLPHMQGILCELSLAPLYEGQRLWREMIRRLELEGFTLWSIQKGFTDLRNGRMLQVDAAFFRL
jgi:FkbM family methyltransferase